jgi:hypothetical protein
MEFYGQNKIRAQARANLLNRGDCGWIVVEVEGGFAVKHDGSPAPQPVATARLCLVQVNRYRKEIVLKAA